MILRSTFFASLMAISSIAPVFADVAPIKEPVAQEQQESTITRTWSAIGELGTIAKITTATGAGLVAGIAILATIKAFGGDIYDALPSIIKGTTALGCAIGCSVTLAEGLTSSIAQHRAHMIRMKELEFKR